MMISSLVELKFNLRCVHSLKSALAGIVIFVRAE